MTKRTSEFSSCRVSGCSREGRCMGVSQFKSDLELEVEENSPAMDKLSATRFIKRCKALGCVRVCDMRSLSRSFIYNRPSSR